MKGSNLIGTKRRDLTIISLPGENCLVIACDSCGAVGIKDHDVLKMPSFYTAKFTTRVALSEVMCSGAVPVAIANGVACEMKPTGEDMILGIQEELKNAGISEIELTGSTEENFQTSMTAMSITVIGTAREGTLKFRAAENGDRLILLGRPKVGDEVDLESKGFYTEIAALLDMPEVKEIVPVGSKGVGYEASTLAGLSGKKALLHETEINIDYLKSAGPATCLLILSKKVIPFGTLIGEIIE